MARAIINDKRLKPPTKKQLAMYVVNHRSWAGEKSVSLLCKNYSKEEIRDILNTMTYM